MASSVVIPFNNNPVSVSVKTASYTIPAGKFARVVVNVIGSGTFTINGNTALSGTQNNVITSVNNMYRAPGSGVIAASQPYQPGAIQTTVSGTTTSQGSAQNSLLVYGNETDQKPLIQDYYLSTGTVINGTGTWRATVEEYNI
jgi:hypothetical protein